MTDDFKYTGRRIAKYRKLRGLTLGQTAAAIGIHRSTLLRWERGDTEKLSMQALSAAAEALGTTVACLTGAEHSLESGACLILTGMPGSGKSTAGVILAKAMGMDFLDTDLLLSRRAVKAGKPGLLQEFIDREGIEAFLDFEQRILLSLKIKDTVTATGGSAVLSSSAMAHLKTLGPVIYLKVSVPELKRRLSNIASRGVVLLPGQTIEELYNIRKPLYEKYADAQIDCTGLTVEQTVDHIIRCVGDRGEI